MQGLLSRSSRCAISYRVFSEMNSTVITAGRQEPGSGSCGQNMRIHRFHCYSSFLGRAFGPLFLGAKDGIDCRACGVCDVSIFLLSSG